MTRQVQTQAVIDGLVAEVADVQAAVVASRDGLSMASTIGGAEGSRVAAMAATVHAVGNRVTSTTDLGTIEETVIRGDAMTFVVYDAGDAAVLALMAPGDCNLGMIHLEGRRAASAVSDLLDAASSTSVEPPPPPPAPAPAPAPASSVPSTSEASSPSPSASESAPSSNGTSRGDHERDVETTSA